MKMIFYQIRKIKNELFFVVPDTARVIRSESKAIDIATRFFEGSDFYTRGNKESSVAKVCLDNGEPALYIVNFGNEEGFVIISASKDAAPILAYSETGAL